MPESRYEHAYLQARAAAIPVAQLDFLETLEMFLCAGMISDDANIMITEGRAVEMLRRFEHYCKALSKLEDIGQVLRSLVLG